MANQNVDFTNMIIRADDNNNEAINALHNYYCLEKYIGQEHTNELIEFLKERSDQSKPYSLLHLSMVYLLGLGINKDFNKGIELLKNSVDVGCSEAYYLMAILVLTKQIEYEMDYDELISKAMEMKNSSAFIQKGFEYSDTDFKKSSEFFKKAIALNNDTAIYRLGELYHDNKKYKLAIKYYKIAMDKNVHHAYFNLAIMYREGEGVKIDFVQAKKLFKKAMELDNVRAITCIGGLHETSDNIQKAKKYYKLAINKDDTFAKYNLGMLYEKEKKYKKAIKCFIESAKDEHMASQYKLLNDYNVTNLNIIDEEIDELLNFHYAFRNFGAYDGFLSH